ncbi:MAG TPA: hypothetical protein VIQ30_00535, partial [Pseudonocardia sp.]
MTKLADRDSAAPDSAASEFADTAADPVDLDAGGEPGCPGRRTWPAPTGPRRELSDSPFLAAARGE